MTVQTYLFTYPNRQFFNIFCTQRTDTYILDMLDCYIKTILLRNWLQTVAEYKLLLKIRVTINFGVNYNSDNISHTFKFIWLPKNNSVKKIQTHIDLSLLKMTYSGKKIRYRNTRSEMEIISFVVELWMTLLRGLNLTTAFDDYIFQITFSIKQVYSNIKWIKSNRNCGVCGLLKK